MSKVLMVGLLSPVPTVNPRESRDRVSNLVIHQIYESPYAPPKGDGTAVPVLFDGPLTAEPSVGGQQVLSAAVRSGVTFSDGTTMTAGHVAASLDRAEHVRQQARTEARANRVFFTLATPNPRFDLALTLSACSVTREVGGRVLGTGPFMLAPGSPLDAPRLVRNPRYREPVAIDEIVFVVYPPNADGRPEALLKALAKGDVDFTDMLSRTDATEATGVRKAFQPANSTAILYFNVDSPALAKKETRRGLALALDRMALTEVSYTNALAFTASNMLPPSMGAGWDGFTHDLNKSQALLGAAGARPTSTLRLLRVWAPRPYLPQPRKVSERIVEQLAKVGVTVEVVTPQSADDFFRHGKRGDYDMLLGGWIADTPDPADFFEANLRSDRIPGLASTGTAAVNYGRIKSPEIDAALKRFRENPSPGNRAAVLGLVTEEAPLVPLMHGPTVVVSAWRMKNIEISPLGAATFASVSLD